MSITSKFKKKSLVAGIALAATMLTAPMSQAANWSSTSLLLHSGSGYELGKDDRTILTLEHVSGWNYGSNFFFIDATEPNSDGPGETGFYGEFSPSLSLGKLSGSDMSFGIVKDVSLEGTWEVNQFGNAKLFGVGLALDIPNVPVANLKLYQRFTENNGESDSAPQVTFVWMAPFALGSTNWVFEGFLDYAFEEKDVGKVENIIAAPRLLLDTGALWGAPKQLYTGIEYQYWMNKFGVDGVDENVVQATVKWTF